MEEEAAREQMQRRFLIFAVIGVSLVFLWMIRSFLMAVLVAALAAGMARPVHDRIARLLGGREVLAAALVVLLAFLLVVGPAVGLIGLVVGQAIEITQALTPWVQQQLASSTDFSLLLQKIPFADLLPLDEIVPDRDRLIESAANAVRAAGSVLVDGAAAAGRTTAAFLLQLFIMLYAMFFFLFQGREILERILYYAPLGHEDEELLLERFVSVTRATLRGSLLIGGVQGLLAGLAFWAAGIQGAAFWGTVMMVLSVIPGIGAPIVWIPAAIWLFGTGQTLAGVLFTLWCAGVVGSIDNVLRPRLVGSDAKMSDLMILLSTLGGITLFGPLGFVLGPILAAIFSTTWELYGVAFSGLLPATSAASNGQTEREGQESSP